MKEKLKRVLKLFGGVVLSSFSITCIIKAGFGCFSTTAMNMAFANWLNVSIGISGLIVELIILGVVIKMKEGVGLATILNSTLGSILIDVFILILPSYPLMILGLLLLPIAWFLVGSSGFGDTSSNLLMNGILKRTNKSVGLIRGIQECSYLVIGLLGARESVTLFTLILSLGLGYLLEFEYKLLKYNPTEVKHQFLIKSKKIIRR